MEVKNHEQWSRWCQLVGFYLSPDTLEMAILPQTFFHKLRVTSCPWLLLNLWDLKKWIGSMHKVANAIIEIEWTHGTFQIWTHGTLFRWRLAALNCGLKKIWSSPARDQQIYCICFNGLQGCLQAWYQGIWLYLNPFILRLWGACFVFWVASSFAHVKQFDTWLIRCI